MTMNKTVKRLIHQYNEYVEVSDKILKLKGKLLRSKLANKQNEFDLLSIELNLQEKLLNRISDEMSFKDHMVWILYKYYAYKGTNKNMDTLADLKQHCMPEDYVCTKRFEYLCSFVNLDKYDNTMTLNKFVVLPEISKLNENIDFMQGWQEYEYYIKKGKISKWKNYR